jgi:hypothetical protein
MVPGEGDMKVPVACVVLAGILLGGGREGLVAANEREGQVEGATYRGAGRRDPFVRPGSAPGTDARTCRARGLEGVRARDLALRGVVRTSEGFLALLVGPDGEAHVAHEGDRLCDARVLSIDPDGVDLEEDTVLPTGVVGSRTVRLRLHAR